MSDLVTPSGNVHWIGAGLSTGSGLRVLCDNADSVVLWNRTVSRAEERLTRLGLSARAAVRGYSLADLDAHLRPGDVVVSMLPAGEHAGLLRRCLDRKAHFACTSYTAPDMSALAPELTKAGLVALTEAGLDPGIDHLFAHRLVAEGRAVVGDDATASFTSYCGGLPAEPNEFRYRFSWAPRGVLRALLSTARYVGDEEVRTVRHPWTATEGRVVAGTRYEVYPNRDSLPFVGQYGFPSSWRLAKFVRGTIRLDGWRAAWAPVFDVLLGGEDARIDALADELAERYPSTDADRDHVVLEVVLTLHGPGGDTWTGGYVLDLVGDEVESAMARTVSLPVAFGVTELLGGRLSAGLHRAAEDADTAERWLTFLAGHGVRYSSVGPVGSP